MLWRSFVFSLLSPHRQEPTAPAAPDWIVATMCGATAGIDAGVNVAPVSARTGGGINWLAHMTNLNSSVEPSGEEGERTRVLVEIGFAYLGVHSYKWNPHIVCTYWNDDENRRFPTQR